MEFHELRSLSSLNRTGNISRSAELLNLTPSAIHRHLKLLSEELQLTLYEKGRNGLHLTPAATSLMPLVEDLLLQHDAILTAAEDLHAHRRGSVRIGAGPTFSSYVLPGILEEFRRRHPQIEINLEAGHTDQLLGELADGDIDLVFLVPRPDVEKDFFIELSWAFHLPLVAYPAIGFPASPRLEHFASYPFVLYRKGSYFENRIDSYFTSHDFSPRVVMRLDNAEPIKALVKSGFGISLLPEWAIRREIESGELIQVPMKTPWLRCHISLIRRRGKYIAPACEALIATARCWRDLKLVRDARRGGARLR